MHERTATLEPALPRDSRGTRVLAIGLAMWLVVAIAIAISGVLANVRPLAPVWVFGTIAGGVVAYRRNVVLRRFADRVDLRLPILLHLLRAAIGVKILVATGEGIIPELFGHRAGPGDIAIGVLAIAAAAVVPRGALSSVRGRVVLVWCALGILDLVIAFATGQYLIWVIGDPRMLLIGDLPWSLLPAIVVPVMILSHLLVIARVRTRSNPPSASISSLPSR